MADKDEIMKEVVSIREKMSKLVESKGIDSPEFKQLSEKTEDVFNKFEDLNSELTKKSVEAEEKAAETLDRIKTLEEILANNSGGAEAVDVKGDSFDVMNALITQNWGSFVEDPANMQKAERAFAAMKGFDLRDSDAKQMANLVKNYNEKASNDLLRTDVGEYGQYLCMPEYSAETNKLIVEYGNVRQFARVKSVSSKTYKEIIRAGIPKAFRTGEARPTSKSTSLYTETDFSPMRMSNITPITQEQLLYDSFNIAQDLMIDNAEAFAVKEAQEFFNGKGISNNEGLGFTVDKNVPEYTTAASGAVTFDDMIKMSGQLKKGYNPLWMFSRKTLSELRLLKDSNGRYLWNPAFGDAASGAPATINGIRYSADFIEFDNVDTVGGFPILLADMQRFYQIVDRADMTVLRDDLTRKAEGIVEFMFQKYCFGKPKLHEAGIRMKVKA